LLPWRGKWKGAAGREEQEASCWSLQHKIKGERRPT
jgi:hypothetical protein